MYLKDKECRLTLRLSKRELQKIANLAKKMNRSKSEFVRMILTSYLVHIENKI